MTIDYSQTYIYKLHAVASVLDKAFDKVLRTHSNITFSQLNILLAAQQFNNKSNQREIARFLEITPAAISRQIENCMQKGWISTKKVKSSRREQSVSLTPKGSKALNDAVLVLEEHLFSVFCDTSKSLDLFGHLEHLLDNTKQLLASYDNNRKEVVMSVQIPKARQLFRGDINDAVIRVQKATGIEISPAWWNANVGNDGGTESILDRFDRAYEKFVQQQTK